jgi:hypothetical protein
MYVSFARVLMRPGAAALLVGVKHGLIAKWIANAGEMRSLNAFI